MRLLCWLPSTVHIHSLLPCKLHRSALTSCRPEGPSRSGEKQESVGVYMQIEQTHRPRRIVGELNAHTEDLSSKEERALWITDCDRNLAPRGTAILCRWCVAHAFEAAAGKTKNGMGRGICHRPKWQHMRGTMRRNDAAEAARCVKAIPALTMTCRGNEHHNNNSLARRRKR